MASFSSRFFAPFEGTRSPYPIAVFRIAFFGALALHFFPALVVLDDSYRPRALRTDEWSHWLFMHFTRMSPATVQALAIVTMLACVAGVIGYRPRAAAAVSFVGFYAFASFNGLPVQTLALLDAWAILLLWVLCGGGSAALSVDAYLRKSKEPPREPRLLGGLILFQLMLAVFFAGVEKVLAGWPGTNEMGVLLSYPAGFLVRDWVAATPLLRAPAVTTTLSWLTLIVELGAPVLLMRRARWPRLVALAVYEAFFLGIIAMLEVPLLFYLVFAAGGLLALGDEDVDWLLVRVRRSAARAT